MPAYDPRYFDRVRRQAREMALFSQTAQTFTRARKNNVAALCGEIEQLLDFIDHMRAHHDQFHPGPCLSSDAFGSDAA